MVSSVHYVPHRCSCVYFLPSCIHPVLTIAQQFQTAAALLKEYTVTDRGTWLSTPKNVTDLLVRYNEGKDEDENDPLLNPAFFLSSNKTCTANKAIADRFLSWTISEEGQAAVENYRRPNSTEWLYTRAPTGKLDIKNCGAP